MMLSQEAVMKDDFSLLDKLQSKGEELLVS